MASPVILPWADPLATARAFYALEPDASAFVFLYSGLRTSYSGRYSILALRPKAIIRAQSIGEVAQQMDFNDSDWQDRWFGGFGYASGASGKTQPGSTAWAFTMQPVFLAQYCTVLVFDHEARRITCHGEPVSLLVPQNIPAIFTARAEALASNFTKQEYLAIIERTLRAIHAGDFYQANITRKFFGRFTETPDAFGLFSKLAENNPAPYSAFLKCDDTFILSSSPELFLRFEAEGIVRTRPIKGSLARKSNIDTTDARDRLAHSAKDRAENLMIVDLMRNDLSQVCLPGSVQVPALCEVDSFATLHHLSSEITARKRSGVSNLDVLAACFPPGSMTGAPKRAAIDHCTEMEKAERGLYSGALGWLGKDSGELSVVIRTLIIEGTGFEMQAGGGIVADSLPESEWRESLLKLMAIAEVCGITPQRLAAI